VERGESWVEVGNTKPDYDSFRGSRKRGSIGKDLKTSAKAAGVGKDASHELREKTIRYRNISNTAWFVGRTHFAVYKKVMEEGRGKGYEVQGGRGGWGGGGGGKNYYSLRPEPGWYPELMPG